MEFRIEKINSKYVIFDQDGAAYGSYDNKADVEVAIEGWIKYYQEDTNVAD
jgi:hypothetical protein